MNTYYIDLYGKGHIISFYSINPKQKQQLNKIGLVINEDLSIIVG